LLFFKKEISGRTSLEPVKIQQLGINQETDLKIKDTSTSNLISSFDYYTELIPVSRKSVI
jgi:hypothetical protein